MDKPRLEDTSGSHLHQSGGESKAFNQVPKAPSSQILNIPSNRNYATSPSHVCLHAEEYFFHTQMEFPWEQLMLIPSDPITVQLSEDVCVWERQQASFTGLLRAP